MRSLLLAPVVVALLLAAAPPLPAADARLRTAQETLKTLGFYTGSATGELNDETRGALKRFQIYNGLNATGELNAETEAALSEGEAQDEQAPPAHEPEPQPAPEPRPEEGDREFLKRETPAPQPTGGEAKAFAELYLDTPYWNAPPEVQRETVAKAQTLLAKLRLYDGPANGRPGPDLEEALFRYQSSRGLRLSGRLDLDTLASLRLLPVGKPRPSSGNEQIDNRVRIPKGPSGAVRGIPLDEVPRKTIKMGRRKGGVNQF